MLSDISELFDCAARDPALDRRLARRLVDIWARTARGRFPSWAAFQENDLGSDWNWIFVVDLERSLGFPYFIYLGEQLAKMSDIHLSGETDWTMTVLEKAASDIYGAVIEEGPHHREDILTLCDGRKVQFRAVTAPLADDGETISHIIGAATGRFVQKPPLSVV